MDEDYKNVDILRCRNIGERGALALAAAFIRGIIILILYNNIITIIIMIGCTPIITVLDLTRCAVQTRGFGRILHGIRLGNISSLKILNARGNHITGTANECTIVIY
jgi:hypothetical protein